MKKKIWKKVHNAEKTESGDPLVSPGMVCYAGKQEKSFWFSSLGQIIRGAHYYSSLEKGIHRLEIRAAYLASLLLTESQCNR